MCIYSVLFKSYDRKPNEIIIEHISSYNKEEMENILTKMLEFIKENHILKDLCTFPRSGNGWQRSSRRLLLRGSWARSSCLFLLPCRTCGAGARSAGGKSFPCCHSPSFSSTSCCLSRTIILSSSLER